jgi:thiosulfate/3-mercaptopyruvate sulfurtransferase
VQPLPDLVPTDALARILDAKDLVVLDATYFLPNTGKHGREEYEHGHIPGAIFFDIDEISDKSSPLPQMLPPAAQFSAAAGELGIGDATQVVVYDAQGLASAPRVWWMFRMFGHARVSVLDGGLPKWRREGRPLATAVPVPDRRRFTARTPVAQVRSRDEVEAATRSTGQSIIDARSAGRFAGTDPEPRPGLRGGHIPTSVNLPSSKLIDPNEGTLLPQEDLRKVFLTAGIDPSRPAICTCGSGVSACVIAFALHRLGNANVAVYDGSWSEWGATSG